MINIDTSNWGTDEVNVLLTAIGVALALILAIVAALNGGFDRLQRWNAAKLLKRSLSETFYLPEEIERATKFYVSPNCTSIDPTYEAEISHLVVVENKLFIEIDKFLSKNSLYRHLLILADSGMGKTSCLLNYYVHNERRWRAKHQIIIVPLGRPDVDTHIEGIANKKDIVIFWMRSTKTRKQLRIIVNV